MSAMKEDSGERDLEACSFFSFFFCLKYLVDSKTPQDHYRKFDFVFRTYFLPQIFVPPIHPRILWIPNGPRSDSGISFVPSGLLPSTRRKILCNFIGAVSGNPVARTIARQELKASLERQKNPCFLDITGQVREDIFCVVLKHVLSFCQVWRDKVAF